MAGSDKRKQSLYFPDDMLSEITREAIRLDRSLSWMVQRAWRIASEGVGKFPSMSSLLAGPAMAAATPGKRPGPVPEAQPVAGPDSQPSSQVREFLSGKFENK